MRGNEESHRTSVSGGFFSPACLGWPFQPQNIGHGFHSFPFVLVQHMLVCPQDHEFIPVSHELGQRLELCAALYGVCRIGMAQRVRRDPPMDPRAAQGRMPCPVNCAYRLAPPVDDVLGPAPHVFVEPLPQQGQDGFPDRQLTGALFRALGGVGHADNAVLQIDILPAEPEKFAWAYARPAVGSQDYHTPDVGFRRMEDAAQLFRRRWSHALGAGLRQAQAGQGILRQDAHFHRPIERGSQDGDAPVDRRLAKAPRFLEFHELEHVRAGEARCLALAIKREDMRGMVCRLLCRCPIGQRDGKVSLKELFHRHARA